MSPSFSSNGGGEELAISVEVDGEAPSVWIGQKEALVDRVEDGIVYVVLPETKRAGWTPITVETEAALCTREDGISLFEHGEGLVGAFGSVEWHEYQGDYWVDGTAHGSAEFKFVRPVEAAFSDAYGRDPDSCESGYSSDMVVNFQEYLPEAPAQLNGPNGSLAFAWDVKSAQYKGNLAPGDFTPSSSYSLQPIYAESDWPRFELPAFVETPSEIAITNPNVDGQWAPDMWTSSLNLDGRAHPTVTTSSLGFYGTSTTCEWKRSAVC